MSQGSDESSKNESTSPAASEAQRQDSVHDPSAEEKSSDETPEYEPHPDEEEIRENVVGVLKTIFDPEIPVNIYDIGLIYSITVDKDSKAYIRMTLTSPMCPVAGTLPGEVEQKTSGALGVRESKVELVWDPPWGPDKMSEATRLQLNL